MTLFRIKTPPHIWLAVSVVASCIAIASKTTIAGYVAVDLFTIGKSAVIEGQPQTAATGNVVGSSSNHAILWSNGGQPTDLNPTTLSGITSSSAVGAAGAQQVGYGYSSSISITKAVLWNGSAGSAVNLNPSGYDTSYAYGTNGSQQVGYASGSPTGGNNHAFLWNGSGSSFTDLNPTNLQNVTSSVALATNGTRQAGAGFTNFNAHAMIWNGTPDSAVDLNPTNIANIVTSFLNGISPNGQQQVGTGNTQNGPLHAMLWNSAADSAVDLHPANFLSSAAYGTNGTQQVGTGFLQEALDCGCTLRHALVWSGNVGSVFDLQTVLPSSFIHSDAYTIDAAGNIFGLAWDPDTGVHAIEWEPTAAPEPTATALLGVCAIALLRRSPRFRTQR